MVLHLGQDVLIPKSAVVAVFDLDNSSQSRVTRDFLKRAEQAGQVVNVSEELPKAFVLVQRDGKSQVYLTQLSSATLLKRCDEQTF